MCAVLSVSSSGYFAWRRRPSSKRAVEDELLSEKIREVFDESEETYGYPRVCIELRELGMPISRDRTARLMRESGLTPEVKRRYVVTTDSKHDGPFAPNLLDRDFTADAPNRKWAGDITYIPTREGWLYLAVFLDLFSRRVIGWSMSDSLHAELTRSAILMALQQRRPQGSLIVHSDRGVQYSASDYRQLLADWTLVPSMSNKGNCYDNAVSESYFATMKKDRVHRCDYQTHDEARLSIYEYIETFYNRKRRHSTIDYKSPVQFEAEYCQRQAGADEPTTVVNPSSKGVFHGLRPAGEQPKGALSTL